MFRGKFEHSIDGKGRLSIPARYRDELVARGVETLVLTEGDHCIWAYPLDEWERFEERLRQQPHPQITAVALPAMSHLAEAIPSSTKTERQQLNRAYKRRT